jgi:capsular polysaccharide transport system permease protein
MQLSSVGGKIGGEASAATGSARRAGGSRRSMVTAWVRWLLLLSPTLIALVYFGALASDRYVSEAQIIIRTASKPLGSSGGVASLLQEVGLSTSQDDINAVKSYLDSRDATQQLGRRLPLSEIYGSAGADPISRYPSVIYGASLEELHNYLRWMITTEISYTTGILTLQVRAFKPEDAKRIAMILLELSEEIVNELNARIRDDSVRVAKNEVSRNQERLEEVQLELTKFRNSELIIDPNGSSLVVEKLIADLGDQLAKYETLKREASAGAPNAPDVISLERRTLAIGKQIAEERSKISNNDDNLATKLATYERLVLQLDFAEKSLASAVTALDQADLEARRQQLYLQRIVEPMTPDYPVEPERVREILTFFLGNVLVVLVGWLLFAGVREHALEVEDK